MGYSDAFKRKMNIVNSISPQDTILDDLKAQFKEYLHMTPTRKLIKVNNSVAEYLVDIQDVSDFNKNNNDEKYCISEYEMSIKVGDYIQFDNINWIVIEKENMTIKDRQRVKIRPCNHSLKYKNASNQIFTLYGCAANALFYSLGVDSNKTLTVVDGRMNLVISAYGDSIVIDRGFRFMFNNKQVFEVTNVDSTTTPGLFYITLQEKEEYTALDDKINNIADNSKFFPITTPNVYDINITNNPNTTIGYYATWQIQWEVIKNGQVVNEPASFISSNTGAVTVNSSGLCQAKNINGSSTVTVKLSSNPTIYTTVRVNVTNTATNYTVDISGASSVTQGEVKQYNAMVKNNGIEVSNAEVVWELNYNGNPQTIALLGYTTDNKVVKISANNVGINGIVYLTAKYKNDLTKLFSKEIVITDGALW